MNDLLNLPESITPNQNEIEHYRAVKQAQTLYNALGLALADLRAEINKEVEKRQEHFKKKYGTDLAHYSFDEYKEIFIRNIGNEQELLNRRLVQDHLSPEIKKAAKQEFFTIYQNLQALYNDIKKLGGLK